MNVQTHGLQGCTQHNKSLQALGMLKEQATCKHEGKAHELQGQRQQIPVRCKDKKSQLQNSDTRIAGDRGRCVSDFKVEDGKMLCRSFLTSTTWTRASSRGAVKSPKR